MRRGKKRIGIEDLPFEDPEIEIIKLPAREEPAEWPFVPREPAIPEPYEPAVPEPQRREVPKTT